MEKPKFNEVIKKLRKDKNLSLTDLANSAEISRPYLSQVESGKKGIPSIQIVNSLANALGVSSYELGWIAGYYTDYEYNEWREREEFFSRMTPEDENAYIKHENEEQKYYFNLQKFQKRKYVKLEDFLNNSIESFYINDHKLTNDEIKMLIHLVRGLEKNYPSDDAIKKEFDKLREERKINKQKVQNGEAFFILDHYFDYDLE